MSDDPYSRVDYRRLVAWPERIEREWPFLATRSRQRRARPRPGVAAPASTAGSWRRRASTVTGIDSSPAMLAKATDTPLPREPGRSSRAT